MDLVMDPLVAKLNNIEIAYIDGPPNANNGKSVKIRAGFIEKPAEIPLRGSFIIVPGRSEYIEKYAETILELTKRGYNCLCVDPRGQGFSDRIGKEYWYGDIDNYDNSSPVSYTHLDVYKRQELVWRKLWHLCAKAD